MNELAYIRGGIIAYGILDTVFYEVVQVWGERVPKAKETIINHMRVKNDAITYFCFGK